MGKAGRFACIFLPMVSTIVTAILIVVSVMIGQTSTGSGLVSKMYFMRVDTRFITIPDDVDLLPGTNIDDAVADRAGINRQIQGNVRDLGIEEWYTAGFWSYCSGNYDNDNGTTIERCSKPKAFFSFNIIDIINENKNPNADNLTFPNQVTKVFKTVNAVSRITWILFMVGLIATGVTFVVGWFGLLSRWGSFCTTIVANVAFIGLLGGAIVNTVLYSLMNKAFNSTYRSFGVRSEFNRNTYSALWLGVAFSLGAAIFWLLSSCFCSGRRDRVMKGGKGNGGSRGFGGEKKKKGPAPDYQRVPSPYSTPLISGTTTTTTSTTEYPHPGQREHFYGQQSTQYEPMRHAQV